jgi:hypothetical protein
VGKRNRLTYTGTGNEAAGIRGGSVVRLSNEPLTLCPAPGHGGVNAKVFLDHNGVYHMFVAGAACDDVDHGNEAIGIFVGTSSDGLSFTFTKTSQYHDNPTDPFELAEDPMLSVGPAGLRMYFSLGVSGSGIARPEMRYYSIASASIYWRHRMFRSRR